MTWLGEFHRRWQAARGQRVTQASRAFSVDWVKLLESSGITSAEDQATAVREVEAHEKSGHFRIKRHRFRTYLIEKIRLNPESEPWLLGLFGRTSASDLKASALDIVADFSQRGHRRFPLEWASLCESLSIAFSAGRSLLPFRWSQPQTLRSLLENLANLSERDWPAGTLIRAASVEIGLDSKALERHQRTYESGLTRLFDTEISLKSLGLASGGSHVELHGPVCLHFPDGTSHDFDGLAIVLISEADLLRCTAVSTTAARLLTIENRKTTFRQFAAANEDRSTLIAATSYPTPAFLEFLTKLPRSLPHHHFGDTDPAGWHILLKLRQATPRPVTAYRMKWRPAAVPNPLTQFDQKLLDKLLSASLLHSDQEEIQLMTTHHDRGNYEQETLGPPVSHGWPFGE
jgi:hypothetical protein